MKGVTQSGKWNAHHSNPRLPPHPLTCKEAGRFFFFFFKVLELNCTLFLTAAATTLRRHAGACELAHIWTPVFCFTQYKISWFCFWCGKDFFVFSFAFYRLYAKMVFDKSVAFGYFFQRILFDLDYLQC